MNITADLMDSFGRRLTGPFQAAAERHGSANPPPFVLTSDGVAYGIAYASQMLREEGRTDLAWQGLKNAADDTDRQLEEYGWMFTVEEAEGLRAASSEIRQLIAEFAPPETPDRAPFYRESDKLRWVAELDYEEIIALSEDPSETFDDVQGRPPTPEEIEQVAAMADALFCQSALDTQVEVVRGWPAHVSARRLALLSKQERSQILACLPDGLAEKVVSLLPMGVA